MSYKEAQKGATKRHKMISDDPAKVNHFCAFLRLILCLFAAGERYAF